MKLSCKQPEKLIKFLIHNAQGMSFASAQKLLRLGYTYEYIKRHIDV